MAETDGAFVTLVGDNGGAAGSAGEGTVSGKINRLCRNAQTTLLMNSDKDLMKQNTERQSGVSDPGGGAGGLHGEKKEHPPASLERHKGEGWAPHLVID